MNRYTKQYDQTELTLPLKVKYKNKNDVEYEQVITEVKNITLNS